MFVLREQNLVFVSAGIPENGQSRKQSGFCEEGCDRVLVFNAPI